MSDEWKRMCDLVVEKLRSELEANPNSEEHKQYVQKWVKGITDTLCPTPAGPAITIERYKDWT